MCTAQVYQHQPTETSQNLPFAEKIWHWIPAGMLLARKNCMQDLFTSRRVCVGSLTSASCCPRVPRPCCDESSNCASVFGFTAPSTAGGWISSLPRTCCCSFFCSSPSSRYLPWIRCVSTGELLSPQKTDWEIVLNVLEWSKQLIWTGFLGQFPNFHPLHWPATSTLIYLTLRLFLQNSAKTF